MDEIQKLTLQSPICEIEDYYRSTSSLTSLKGVCMLETEAESSNTVIMPAMMTGAANLEEQLASMKATLDRLAKESVEKATSIAGDPLVPSARTVCQKLQLLKCVRRAWSEICCMSCK